jgi:hypothetical protein
VLVRLVRLGERRRAKENCEKDNDPHARIL